MPTVLRGPAADARLHLHLRQLGPLGCYVGRHDVHAGPLLRSRRCSRRLLLLLLLLLLEVVVVVHHHRRGRRLLQRSRRRLRRPCDGRVLPGQPGCWGRG
jgi:hypothetical protein